MKNLLFAFILLSISCAKNDISEVTLTKANQCPTVTTAIIKKEMLNVAGTEFFYYLEVPNSIKNSTKVYPGNLDDALHIEGQRVEIRYNTTEELYSYIPCVSLHVTGLIEEFMPMIQLCSAVAKN